MTKKSDSKSLPTPVEQALGQLRTVEDTITALIAETKELSIKDFSDKEGHDAVHAGLMRVVGHRTTIEKAAKDIRQPFIDAQKAVITEEKRLIGLLDPEETRLRNARDAYRAEQERVKKEQEEAARKRVTEMASKLLTLGFAFNGDTYSISHGEDILDITDIRLRLMDDEDFDLFMDDAHRIADAIAIAKAEEERLAKEAAANAERIRIDQERKAAELAAKEAELKRKEEAIAAREAEEARKAELKAAQERAAAQAKADAEAAAQEAIARAKREADEAVAAAEKAKADAEAKAKYEADMAVTKALEEAKAAQDAEVKAEQDRIAALNDKSRLLEYATYLKRPCAELSSEQAKAIMEPVIARVKNLCDYLEAHAAKL